MSSVHSVVRPNVRSRRLRALVAFVVLAPMAWFASRAYVATARPETERLKAAAARALSAAEGIRLAQNRQWIEAVEALEPAVDSGEATSRVYGALGFCLGELGWVDDAAHAYEESIRREPSELYTYV